MNTDKFVISGEVVTELKAGNKAAFELIYGICFDPLYQSVFNVVRNAHITEEILQDVFIKLWFRRQMIDPDKSLKGYLLTIARNQICDHYRKLARERSLVKEKISFYCDLAYQMDPLERKDEIRFFNQAIDRLSPQRKLVFVHCKLEGNSYEQTSAALGISVATVNSHITHSLKLVREFLKRKYLN